MKQLQQGDVLMRSCTKIPKDAKVKKHARGWVLAEGEVTGHAHEVIGEGVEVLEKDGVLYLSAPKGGTIKHEEHKAFTIPPGNYTVGIVKEYDHFLEEARQVAD